VMNHGTEGSANHINEPPPSTDNPGCPLRTQCMRWLRSNDLVHWQSLWSTHPDPRWYVAGKPQPAQGLTARWDAAMMMRDPENAGAWLCVIGDCCVIFVAILTGGYTYFRHRFEG
jgi:hypothetical protein